MKRILCLIAFAIVGVASMNAQTTVEIEAAGDVYWATDNAKVGMGERQLASTNIYKDRFGINNFLFEGKVDNEAFRAAFSFAHFGEGFGIEDANIALNLFKGLWLDGGYHANWDDDYTFNKWFTGNSLTDLLSMGTPYASAGLFYECNPDLTIGLGFMNSGFLGELEENNRSKSAYVKVDWNNLVKDWELTVSFLTGNEEEATVPYTRSQSEVYASFGGPINSKLEANVIAKFFMLGEAEVGGVTEESTSAFSAQLQARYHFNPKFALGLRAGYTAGEDTYIENSGIDLALVCQYNPIPQAYLRLEAGMISLSNSDVEDHAKIFHVGDEMSASRMGIALSMGYKLGLYHNVIGE